MKFLIKTKRFDHAQIKFFTVAHCLVWINVALQCYGLGAEKALENAEAPRQGQALLKSDLMVVLAHPDDETMMAPLIVRAALQQKKVVTHVYVTRGEGGGNMVGTQSGAALGILREVELRDCLRIMGVRNAFFLDQLDFAYTESAGATLAAWKMDEARAALVRFIRALKPEVILTIHPAPFPGQHGHHQTAGILATEAFLASADPSRYPSQLDKEGLSPWQARKLYYSGSGPESISIAVDQPLPDGISPGHIAGEALSNHRSQAFGNMRNSPWLLRPQSVSLAHSINLGAGQDRDLFDGLMNNESITPKLKSALASPVQDSNQGIRETLHLSFLERPAIRRFKAWALIHGIDAQRAELRADLPVVVGKTNQLQLKLVNTGQDSYRGMVQLEFPVGCQGQDKLSVDIPARSEVKLDLPLIVKSDFTIDSIIKATALMDSKPIRAQATLHPVPHATIRRVQSPPWRSGVASTWPAGSELTIEETKLSQGKTTDAADSSAKVHVAHDGNALLAMIKVRDEAVVSNIQPDDIKGHWRSDSVEICIDPKGGSEDTFGCFKLGIFPFDTTGRVRAARDADARPGLVESTAPAVDLESERTTDGYVIRAIIPFSTLGFLPSPGQMIGFNVIVYDGDKKSAVAGENINESRIAWSPRPGVQGRPEDWGRLTIE